MSERCAICRKDITHEITNDWDPRLCYECAKKEHFKKTKVDGRIIAPGQKTVFDNI